MPTFRKRPVVIEATQWFQNGDHPDDRCETITCEGLVVRRYRTPDLDGERVCAQCAYPMRDHGWIDTLEGGHIVCPGDWIITGVVGERYPCKDAIFRATYEPVDGDWPV